jgi:hypothetical protein
MVLAIPAHSWETTVIRAAITVSVLALHFSCSLAADRPTARADEPAAARLRPIAKNGLDLRKAWFAPTLTADTDPICASVAAQAARYFQDSGDWGQFAAGQMAQKALLEPIDLPYDQHPSRDPALQLVPDQPANHYSLSVQGSSTPLYLYFNEIPGCGGACNQQRLAISKQPVPQFDPHSQPDDPAVAMTPPSSLWTLYRASSGEWYAVGIVASQRLQMYSLAAPPRGHLACELALVPPALGDSKEPTLDVALQAIHAFKAAVDPLIGSSGDCSSMATASRWRSRLGDSLLETLYRPWRLRRTGPERRTENTHRNYVATLAQLRLWSLTGWAEHAAFQRYQEQLVLTAEALQHFYTLKFGWSESIAARMAYEALTTAVANSMGFSAYTPFTSSEEQQLRTALFAQRPLAELKAIKLAEPAKNAVLDLAVHYPEVLDYLLQSGADPDSSNAFGKTALMYAAQYDSLPAAALLLKAGADPNAATHWPTDDCYYTLQTSKMTALHYAARYASAGMVRLLLNNGAATFNGTVVRTGGNEGYPLDWLERHTGPDAKERNPNIDEGERRTLQPLLRVPAEAERARIAKDLVLSAAAEHTAGRTRSAYRALQSALSAQSSNLRALDDLATVAFQYGRTGVALEAASNLIASDAGPEVKARAWFNLGMSCQQTGSSFAYNGEYYCWTSNLHAFLQAWQVQASAAHQHKLKELFESDALKNCAVTVSGATQKYHFTRHTDTANGGFAQSTRIYVHHSKAPPAEPAQVSWEILVNGGQDRTSQKMQIPPPRLLQRYDFDDFAISVLESPHFVQGPVTIGNRKCPAAAVQY